MRALIVLMLLSCSGVAFADMAPDVPPPGFWDVLVKAKQRWVLKSDKDAGNDRLVVETYDVRTVGTAKVARLRWTLLPGKSKTKRDVGDSGSGRYTQLAVTKAGLYVMSADMDDAKILEVLKGKPSRSDPPKAYSASKQNQGRYLKLRGEYACMGFEPLPGAGDCEDICEGEVCFSRDNGVVSVSGKWSPTEFEFALP